MDEWVGLLRLYSGKPARGFESLPFRHERVQTLTVTLRSRLGNEIDSYSFFNFWRGARAAEWGALLRRCPGKPDRGFKSHPLRHG